MTGIVVELDTRQLVKKLDRVKRLLNVNGLLKAIGIRQRTWVNENFETEGSSVGGWQTLAESTIARRRKGSSKVLQDTGTLKRSFSYKVIGTNAVLVGTNIHYAQYHEFGTSRVPQRKMLPSETQAKELAVGIIKSTVDKLGKSDG